MRLFIAIPLNDIVRDKICLLQEKMRIDAKGNFTRRENLHITLEFLGETDAANLNRLRTVMDAVEIPPFLITIGRQNGHFGNLWWLSIQGDGLSPLYRKLYEELLAHGFSPDRKPFLPHLTLVREFCPAAGWNVDNFAGDFVPQTQSVNQFTLYQSSRQNGRLTYLPLYSKRL